MPATNLLPVRSVFQEAIDYHRSRVPIAVGDLAKVSSEMKLRAIYAAGLSHQASAVGLHRALDEYIAKGLTAGEARTLITRELAKNGGAVLPAARQNNIIRTNGGLAYANGRLKQLRSPDIVAERPILMYPKGPHDATTTAVCLSLEGFMAEANWPGWNHIAPPNHFQERHLKLISLTREEAAARGTVYDPPAGGGEYPVVNGQQILPGAGFDVPTEMLATDGKQLSEELAKLVSERPAKLPADYALKPLAELPAEARLPLPASVAETVDLATGWETLRDALGFEGELDSTIVRDLFNDGVVVNRTSFDTLFAQTPELTPLLRPMLEDATEVWFVPFETAEGVTVVKRYMAVFADEDTLVGFWADQVPGGWLARGGVTDAEGLEGLRRGYLASTRSGVFEGEGS